MSVDSKDYVVLNGERVSLGNPRPSGKGAPKPTGASKWKSQPWWLRLMLMHPFWTYILIVGGIGVILSHYWRPVEKYFPAMNAFIHRDISDRNDVDYQVYKLQEIEKVYRAKVSVCENPQTSPDTCETAYMAAQPLLASMGDRITKLEVAWERDAVRVSMPVACGQLGADYFKEFDDYVSEERSALNAVKWVDPKAQTSLPFWPKECAGY